MPAFSVDWLSLKKTVIVCGSGDVCGGRFYQLFPDFYQLSLD